MSGRALSAVAVLGGVGILLGVIDGVPAHSVPEASAVFFVEVPRDAPKVPFAEGRLLRLDIGVRADPREPWPGWTVSGRASSSDDGARLLWCGRRASETEWSLWEAPVAHPSTPRRLFTVGTPCASPLVLPSGRVVWSQAVAGSPPGSRAVLVVTNPDGSRNERITFFDSGIDEPIAMSEDGRVLFRRQAGDTVRRMAVEPDGTGVTEYAADLPEPLLPNGHRVSSRAQPTAGARALVEEDAAGSPLNILYQKPGFDEHRQTRGTLLCLDARLTRGPSAAGAERLRVRDASGVLGEVPIAADGSFFVEVPANRALILETLDSQGRVVQGMHQGVWVRPNENRGCIGCHEPPELGPANHRPLAVGHPAVRLAESGAVTP